MVILQLFLHNLNHVFIIHYMLQANSLGAILGTSTLKQDNILYIADSRIDWYIV